MVEASLGGMSMMANTKASAERMGINVPKNNKAHVNATKEIVQAERFLMTAKQAPSDPAMKQELNKALKHLQAAIVFLR